MHGVGGRTIAEAQARMTHAEVMAWAAYRRKYGSLNVGMRLELEVGQLRATVAQALGASADVFAFLPHVPRPEPEKLTMEKVLRVLSSVAPVRK